jgi:hypothetical protein
MQEVERPVRHNLAMQRVLRGMSRRDLASLPPFPFPKELFPPGTFPKGLRFSGDGLRGIHPALDAMLSEGQAGGIGGLMEMMTMMSHGEAASTSYHPAGRTGGPPQPGSGSSEGAEDSGSEWSTASEDDWQQLRGYEDGSAGDPGTPEVEDAGGHETRATSDDSDGLSSPSSPGSEASSTVGYHARTQAASGLNTQTSGHTSSVSSGHDRMGDALPPSLIREFMLAARSCDIQGMQQLLSTEPRLLHAQNQGLGHTALHWCAARNSGPAVEWLLQQGANPSALNASKATPLHAAARHGAAEAVQVLLATEQVDVGAVDEDGMTAEQYALVHAHPDLAQVLRTAQQSPPASSSWVPPVSNTAVTPISSACEGVGESPALHGSPVISLAMPTEEAAGSKQGPVSLAQSPDKSAPDGQQVALQDDASYCPEQDGSKTGDWIRPQVVQASDAAPAAAVHQDQGAAQARAQRRAALLAAAREAETREESEEAAR